MYRPLNSRPSRSEKHPITASVRAAVALFGAVTAAFLAGQLLELNGPPDFVAMVRTSGLEVGHWVGAIVTAVAIGWLVYAGIRR